MIGFDHLRVECPYEIKTILEIQMECKPNEHASLYLRGIVDEDLNVNATLKSSFNDDISIFETGSQDNKTIFKGLVTSVKTTKIKGIYYIEIKGISGSFQLDIKKKSRSFQDSNMKYAELVKEVIKEYPDSDFIKNIGNDVKIDSPIIQFKETDWEFIKRLASHFQAVIVSDIIQKGPRFHFGMSLGKSYTIEENIPYTASKDLYAYEKAGGQDAGYQTQDFFFYEVVSGERYFIGDEIEFRKKKMYVSEVKASIIKGLLMYTYRLSKPEGIRQNTIYNMGLSGASLEGKVLDVRGESIKLHLDIDKEQSKDKAYWFPFIPPTGNVMYCMSIVGTQSSLYFPDATGNNAKVLGSVRKNGGTCQKTASPNIRYFGTEHGSELEMSPTGINITGGCKEPLKFSFDDEKGVSLISHKKLTLSALGEIKFESPKGIIISAQSQIFALRESTSSGLTVESEYHFLGDLVVFDGRDRTPFSPFNDAPKPKPKKSFDWGKVIVFAIVAVAVVAAVAVSVATFGAGAVAGAALVGAAIGAVGGIAGTAASDIANKQLSSPLTYLENAVRGALVGAVVGAIFGPIGMAGGSALAMTSEQLMMQYGRMLLTGGMANSTYYMLDEMAQGCMPNTGEALKQFRNGVLFTGVLMVAAPWISKACNKLFPGEKPVVEEPILVDKPVVEDPIPIDYKGTLNDLDAKGYDEFLIRTKGVFASESDAQKAFQQLLNRDFKGFAKNFDFSTEPNKAYFWSGDKDFASNVAKSKGCTIMENTPGGKVIDGWDWLNEKFPADGNWATGNDLDPKPLWVSVSKQYAKGVSGKVTYVNQDYEGGVWLKDESKIIDKLMDKGVVTELDYYNKEYLINMILDKGEKGW